MAPARLVRDDFLIFGSPAIGEDEIEEVTNVLRTGWLGTGPKVAQFEEKFLKYKQSKYAVAVNSCTAALHLSLLVAGIKSGDEVITTPLTFCATVNAIIHAGGVPVLVDVHPDTMNINSSFIERKITKKTKAILLVHFAGRPCDMEAIQEIVRKHHLVLIEDCAHAIETTYHGKSVGTFGDFGCFSFYVTKNVVTGEGGMVTTPHAQHADRVKMMALHGMTKDAWKRFSDEGYKHYYVQECGFKYNMMDLQAAIGLHQLQRVEFNWKLREKIWNQYNQALAPLPIGIPAPVEKNTRHAYHLYTVLIDEQKGGVCRDQFLERMTKNNIGVGVHYLSIPEHPYYQQKFRWCPEDYPHAMRIGRQTVSLPLSAKLTEDDAEDVIAAVQDSLKT